MLNRSLVVLASLWHIEIEIYRSWLFNRDRRDLNMGYCITLIGAKHILGHLAIEDTIPMSSGKMFRILRVKLRPGLSERRLMPADHGDCQINTIVQPARVGHGNLEHLGDPLIMPQLARINIVIIDDIDPATGKMRCPSCEKNLQ